MIVESRQMKNISESSEWKATEIKLYKKSTKDLKTLVYTMGQHDNDVKF